MTASKKLSSEELMTALHDYGYELLAPEPKRLPAVEVLKALLAQDDMRLLEGFPVVLANALKQAPLNELELSPKDLPKKSYERLNGLLAASVLLFHFYGVEKEVLVRAEKLLARFPSAVKEFTTYRNQYETVEAMPVGGNTLSVERLKRTFQNYMRASQENPELEKKQQSLEREVMLSHLFTPAQKQLLRKRLQHQQMTKTEREYYYRVVKKRLKALANEDLHQMARKLVSE